MKEKMEEWGVFLSNYFVYDLIKCVFLGLLYFLIINFVLKVKSKNYFCVILREGVGFNVGWF